MSQITGKGIRMVSRVYTQVQGKLAHRCVAFTLTLVVLFVQVGALALAQGLVFLPEPGAVVRESVVFSPAMMTGLVVYPHEPLRFDFIMDPGQRPLEGQALTAEAQKLIKYFLAALTVPEDELWVNLSPYEADRVIPDRLGVTDLGRDLLAQDYLLKQLTASFMHPDHPVGAVFWERLYVQAQDHEGETDLPVDAFHKVWIVPQTAVVYEHGQGAFVGERHLKVMLEQDYQAELEDKRRANFRGVSPVGDAIFLQEEAQVQPNGRSDALGENPAPVTRYAPLNETQARIMREVILPEVEREVNQGEHFAALRQIYNSMILAAWYKQVMKDSLLSQVYVNQNKVKGVDLEDRDIREKIYAQYLEAFRLGVYNAIREEYDPIRQEVVPRHYFTGGIEKVGPHLVRRPLDSNAPVASNVVAPSGERPVRVSSKFLAEKTSHQDPSMLAMAREDWVWVHETVQDVRQMIAEIDLMDRENDFMDEVLKNSENSVIRKGRVVFELKELIAIVLKNRLDFSMETVVSAFWIQPIIHKIIQEQRRTKSVVLQEGDGVARLTGFYEELSGNSDPGIFLNRLEKDFEFWNKNMQLDEKNPGSLVLNNLSQEDQNAIRQCVIDMLDVGIQLNDAVARTPEDRAVDHSALLRDLQEKTRTLINLIDDAGIKTRQVEKALLKAERWPYAGGLFLADQIGSIFLEEDSYLLQRTASQGSDVKDPERLDVKRIRPIHQEIQAARQKMIHADLTVMRELVREVIRGGKIVADILLRVPDLNEGLLQKSLEIKEAAFDGAFDQGDGFAQRMSVEIAQFTYHVQRTFQGQSDKAMLTSSLPETLGGFNVLDNPDIRRVMEWSAADPERREALEALGDVEAHAQSLRARGKRIGLDGRVVLNAAGSADPHSAFSLAKDADDVVSIGPKAFGTINDVQKFFSSASAFYRAGGWFDAEDTDSDFRVLMEDEGISGIGPLVLARIMAFLNGRILGIHFFDIRDDGGIRFAREAEAQGSNAVVEFLVEDEQGQPVTKRFWYVQHDFYTGQIRETDLHVWGITPREMIMLKNKGYVDDRGKIQSQIIQEGFNTFRYKVGEAFTDPRDIHKKLEWAYRQQVSVKNFIEGLNPGAVVIRATDGRDFFKELVFEQAEKDHARILVRSPQGDFNLLSDVTRDQDMDWVSFDARADDVQELVNRVFPSRFDQPTDGNSAKKIAQAFRDAGDIFSRVLQNPDTFSLETAVAAQKAQRIYFEIMRAEALTAREKNLLPEDADVERAERLELFYETESLPQWADALKTFFNCLQDDRALQKRTMELSRRADPWQQDTDRAIGQRSEDQNAGLRLLAQAVMDAHKALMMDREDVVLPQKREQDLAVYRDLVRNLMRQAEAAGWSSHSRLISLMTHAERWPYSGGLLLAEQISRIFDGGGDLHYVTDEDSSQIRALLSDIRVSRRALAFAHGSAAIQPLKKIIERAEELSYALLQSGDSRNGFFDKALEIGNWAFENDYVLFELSDSVRDMAVEIARFTYQIERALNTQADMSMLASSPTPTGGIDFHPVMDTLEIRRGADGMPLPALYQPAINMDVEGFFPVIMNVTPFTSPFMVNGPEGPGLVMTQGRLD